MRIALIADIHGNAVALDTALDDIAKQGVDQIICLGDVAMVGPQPAECVARVRALNCPVIMGNTDEWLVSEEAAGEPPADLSPLDAVAYWNAAQLSEDDKTFMRGFQPTLEVDLNAGHTLLCFHGSPRDCREAILAFTPEDELHVMLGDPTPAAVLAGAHVHLQILRRYLGATFVNPGSIGMPSDHEPAQGRPRRYTPRAEYAILEWRAGQANITFRRVPYALDDLMAAVAHSGMPAADWWRGQWHAQ